MRRGRREAWGQRQGWREGRACARRKGAEARLSKLERQHLEIKEEVSVCQNKVFYFFSRKKAGESACRRRIHVVKLPYRVASPLSPRRQSLSPLPLLQSLPLVSSSPTHSPQLQAPTATLRPSSSHPPSLPALPSRAPQAYVLKMLWNFSWLPDTSLGSPCSATKASHSSKLACPSASLFPKPSA